MYGGISKGLLPRVKEKAPAMATEFRTSSLCIIGPELYFHAATVATEVFSIDLSVWFIPIP